MMGERLCNDTVEHRMWGFDSETIMKLFMCGTRPADQVAIHLGHPQSCVY